MNRDLFARVKLKKCDKILHVYVYIHSRYSSPF